ncbi:MAG: hypothetical protein J2P58_13120, partial [Acidimicrobiaceae bacterium]|nr:hypothetical protein [Acidimicrobiaceae bacterium]
ALIALNAWRGNEKRALEAVDAGVRDAMARGEGRVVAFAEYFTAVLYNGLARYEDALAAAERATAVDDFGSYGSALAELIEGAARSGASELAREGLDRLRERTGASGTDWALGTEAGSVALVSEGRDAEDAYLESIEHLGRTRVAVHLARAHLLYGEWLRREQRNVDARTHLNTARDMFLRFGADGFAERASRELRATGATVRSRTVTTRDILTPQELQVAKLAADGHTNPEIGARLFISPRTAEYHLHKVYTKLDIDSRRQLRTRIDQLERGAGTTR